MPSKGKEMKKRRTLKIGNTKKGAPITGVGDFVGEKGITEKGGKLRKTGCDLQSTDKRRRFERKGKT